MTARPLPNRSPFVQLAIACSFAACLVIWVGVMGSGGWLSRVFLATFGIWVGLFPWLSLRTELSVAEGTITLQRAPWGRRQSALAADLSALVLRRGALGRVAYFVDQSGSEVMDLTRPNLFTDEQLREVADACGVPVVRRRP